MKNYAVLEGMKRSQKTVLNCAFNKGYEQGYQDGKLDGEAEKIEKLEKQFDDEKKAEYKRGYEQGRMAILTIKDFEEIRSSQYDRGYKDGTKARDGERGSIYYGGYGDGYKDGQKDALKAKGETIAREIVACKEAYEKGLKHGQELRAKEAKCAEACGMKRAWEAARKIVVSESNGGIPMNALNELFGPVNVFENFSVSEAIEKIDAWEEKQKQDAPEMNVGSIAVWDEVEDNIGNRTVVTHIYSDGKYANADVIDADGCFRSLPLELLEKTGRRYCFQELLDTMKKNNVEEADTNENK